MTETIGKVTLNLDKYPGEDYYCDGSVEDEILEIVKKYSTVEYDRIIAERKSWPILYHLSALRENIVDFLPIKKTDKVLEVGSGCGAITGALSRKAGSVTCVDLSKKRSLINAYRHSESENVTIHMISRLCVEFEKEAYDFLCTISDEDMEKAFNGCMSLCDLVIYRIGGRERSGEDRTCKVEI